MKKFLCVFLALIMTFALVACGGANNTSNEAEKANTSTSESGEKIKLVVNTSIHANNPSIKKFAELLEEYSDGRFEVDILESGVLGGERELAEAVQMGTVSVAFISDGYYMGNEFNGLALLPGLVKNEEEVKTMLYGDDSWTVQQRKQGAEAVGLKLIGTLNYSWRYLGTLNTPIETPDDFKKIQPRVGQNEILLAYYEGLGCTPSVLATNEVATALQQGAINGTEDSINNWSSYGADGMVKYILTSRIYVAASIVANADFYNSLSAEDQAILERVGKETTEFSYENIKEYEQEIIDRNPDWVMIEPEGAILEKMDEAAAAAREMYFKTYGDAARNYYEEYMKVYNEKFPS